MAEKKLSVVEIRKAKARDLAMTEKVHLSKESIPEDYHCNCSYCSKFKGVLIRKDGTLYSKLDRNGY